MMPGRILTVVEDLIFLPKIQQTAKLLSIPIENVSPAALSFGEYLYLKLLGTATASSCMVSGSGLWNQNNNAYDLETLAALPVDASQFAPEDQMDKPGSGLTAAYASRWPLLAAIPWFPALGDGAANNVGCGCTAQHRFAWMIGTSGALRVVVEADRTETPEGLWVYRLDSKRFAVGGALTDGGSVYSWLKKTLELPPEAEIEAKLAPMPPPSHGLTVLPLWAGERSPGWRADARRNRRLADGYIAASDSACVAGSGRFEVSPGL
ncbi:MAG: hypothetical protein ACRD3T_01895 [Terriglobia bacterium]